LWPTRPCVGGSRNSASRLRRASSRRRKGCALFTGPRSRNGARSSRLPTSSRSEVRSRAALAPRWLWVVRRIGVVAEHSCDDGAADQRLQRTLQLIGFFLLVNFLAANIERKRLCVLRLFGRILDGLFRPLIKRITFSAVRLCISHVIRERIELAFHHRIMPIQYIGERRNRGTPQVTPRGLRKPFVQGQTELKFQIVTHNPGAQCDVSGNAVGRISNRDAFVRRT